MYFIRSVLKVNSNKGINILRVYNYVYVYKTFFLINVYIFFKIMCMREMFLINYTTELLSK